MPLVVTRSHGQALRMRTQDGTTIVVTVRPGHQPGEAKLVVEAPRSVVVERPERD